MKKRNRILAPLFVVFAFGISHSANASEVSFEIHGMIQVWVQSVKDEINGVENMGTLSKRSEVALVSTNEGPVSWVLMFDLAGGGGKEMQDAFITYQFSDAVTGKAGQFHVPSSLEGIQGAGGLWFPERAFISRQGLGDYRDRGFVAMGDMGDLSYTVGLFNGEGGNANPSEDIRRFAGRVNYKVSDAITIGAWTDSNDDTDDISSANMAEFSASGVDIQWHDDAWSVQAELASKSEPADESGAYIMAKYAVSENLIVAARIDSYTIDAVTGVNEIEKTAFDFGITFFPADAKGLKTQLAIRMGSTEQAGTADQDIEELIANIQFNW